MKACPKCGELNGESSVQCFKCHSKFPTGTGGVGTYTKICVRCKQIYSPRTENCPVCGTRLAVHDDGRIGVPASTRESSSGNGWLFLVAFLIPLVGIILGIVYIARQEDALGKSLIVFSIAMSLVAFLLMVAIGSCSVL